MEKNILYSMIHERLCSILHNILVELDTQRNKLEILDARKDIYNEKKPHHKYFFKIEIDIDNEHTQCLNVYNYTNKICCVLNNI